MALAPGGTEHTPRFNIKKQTQTGRETARKTHAAQGRPPGTQDTDSDPDGYQNTVRSWHKVNPDRATSPASHKPVQEYHQSPHKLEEDYIIFDTQSMDSYIGEDTTGPLFAKMKAAGHEPPSVKDTNRICRIREDRPKRATQLLGFNINLTGTPTPFEVCLVPGSTPFTVGQDWMRKNNMEPDLAGKMVKIDGTWMEATDKGLGRLGVVWSVRAHEREPDASVYTLGGDEVMRGPEWDEMRRKLEMELDTTSGEEETDA